MQKIKYTYIALDFVDANGDRLTCIQSMPHDGPAIAFVDFTNGEAARVGLPKDNQRRAEAYIRLTRQYLNRSIPVRFQAA